MAVAHLQTVLKPSNLSFRPASLSAEAAVSDQTSRPVIYELEIELERL